MPMDHAAGWDARDQLLKELRESGGLPVRTLYIRRDDGGALALGLLPDRRGLAMFEWHNTSYELRYLREPMLERQPYEKKAAGFGGFFGFGEKGSHGWLLRLSDREETAAEIVLLPHITSYADVAAKNDKFLYGRRRPRQIPLWQPIPEDQYTCLATVSLWEQLIREGK
jgi:hypothetical protein